MRLFITGLRGVYIGIIVWASRAFTGISEVQSSSLSQVDDYISSVAVFADAPESWQTHFQDGATEVVMDTFEFYDDLAGVMVFVAIFVAWMTLRALWQFTSGTNTQVPKTEFRHHTQLEVWWTLFPTFILLWIAAPSLTLLYSTDPVEVPDFTFRVIGRQWYWTYELGTFREMPLPMRETVKYRFVDLALAPEPLRVREFMHGWWRWEQGPRFPADAYRLKADGGFDFDYISEKVGVYRYTGLDWYQVTALRSRPGVWWSAEQWFKYALSSYSLYRQTEDFFVTHGPEVSMKDWWGYFLTLKHPHEKVVPDPAWMNAIRRFGPLEDAMDHWMEDPERFLFRRGTLPLLHRDVILGEPIYSTPSYLWDSTLALRPRSTHGFGLLYDYPERWEGPLSPTPRFSKRLRLSRLEHGPTRWMHEWWRSGMPNYRRRNWLLETQAPLVLPEGRSLRLLTTATDVIHSWTVPSFGVKIDACPGRLNQVLFHILRPGLFYGQCSEICGVNHAFMPIEVRALQAASWEAFIHYPNSTLHGLRTVAKMQLEPIKLGRWAYSVPLDRYGVRFRPYYAD